MLRIVSLPPREPRAEAWHLCFRRGFPDRHKMAAHPLSQAGRVQTSQRPQDASVQDGGGGPCAETLHSAPATGELHGIPESCLAHSRGLRCVLSCFHWVLLCVTPWTVAHQTPLSMDFSRQDYWSGLPCPPPEGLPNPGIKPVFLMSPAVVGRSFTTSVTWSLGLCLHLSSLSLAFLCFWTQLGLILVSFH